MASLTGQTIAASYEQLLSLPDGGLSGTTLRAITDGDSSTEIALKVATTAISVDSTDRIYLDGDQGTPHTYLHQVSADKLDVVVGGQTILELTEGGGGASDSLAIQAANKLYLDGGGTTYIQESGDGVMDFYSDAVHMLSLKESSQDEVVINEGGVDVDFRVESDDETHMLVVDGSLNKVGIILTGEMPDLGMLHIKTTDASQGTVSTDADELVLESGGNTGLTILSGSSGTGNIMFGDTSDGDIGRIIYDHSVGGGRLSFNTNAANEAVCILNSGYVGIAEATPAATLSVGAGSGTIITDGSTTVSVLGANVSIDEASKYAMGIKNANASGDGLIVQAGDQSDDNILMVEDYSGVEKFAIDGDGLTTFTSLNGGANHVLIDTNSTATATDSFASLHIDHDQTGIVASGQTNDAWGINLDMNCDSVTHVGTVNQYGIDIDMVAATDGTQKNVGVDINVSGADTNYALLTAGGNVGIGTDVPDGLLHVFTNSAGTVTASADADELILESSGQSGMSIMSGDGHAGNIFFGETSIAKNGYISYNGSADSPADQMTFGTNQADRMSIDSSGNVGIGTTSPGVNLVVEDTTTGASNQGGSIRVSSNDGGALNADARLGVILFSAAEDSSNTLINGASIEAFNSHSGAWDTSNNHTDLAFFTTTGDNSKSEWMRITDDGNVGIGTAAPTAGLHLKDLVGEGTEAASHFRIQGSATSSYSLHMFLDATAAYYGTPSTSRNLRMYAGGDKDIGVKLTNGAESWVASSSDRRSKKNITDLESVLEKVLQLRPRRFDYKNDEDVSGSGDRRGFISQEVGEVFPYLEEVGTDEQMGTVYMSDPGTTSILVKAIQELSAKVTALENA